MGRLLTVFREHLHVHIIIAALTLATTFPTILHIFQPDVFWLPTGNSHDVYIHLWDVWYGKQFLTGQADRNYTDLMFYPTGVPLTHHQFAIPYQILVNAFMSAGAGVSSAFCLALLLIISSSAYSAYAYLLWLFSDKWIATFGAIVFGLSPHVLGHPNQPNIALVMTMPLLLFAFHRGIAQNSKRYIVASGLLIAANSLLNLYVYVCSILTISFAVGAFAVSKWRNGGYWRQVALLAVVTAIGSTGRLVPVLMDSEGLGEALSFYHGRPLAHDVLQVAFNFGGPIIGTGVASVLQISEIPPAVPPVYLGLLPLALITLGLWRPAQRRKMLPWMGLYALFLLLSLGDFLKVAGVEFQHIRLPKSYLNEIVPFVFKSFAEADIFMAGAIFPAAVLVCFGAKELCNRLRSVAKPVLVLLLIALVALDYHSPIVGNLIHKDQFMFLDWLATEGNRDEIRLINLPMGHRNSKRYNLYQLLSGYPHAEGAISRTPDNARNFIRSNAILEVWSRKHPIACHSDNREVYLGALDNLESNGFTHVVFHQNVGNRLVVLSSVENAEPSYRDEFVWIYRLVDLRRSCGP